MFLDSPQGKAPVALQWEFRIPVAVKISAADITVGRAAESAGKSLTCAPRANQPAVEGEARYACILAGGVKPITNGDIAVVRYRVPASAHRGRVGVTIEGVEGVSQDLKSTAIEGATAVIAIR